MIIGIPKEVKPYENRVALTPAGAGTLTAAGHTVLVQNGAGEGSGFSDEEFRRNGAEISDSADEIWQRATLVVKVKEPITEEYGRMREDQILFTYFHFAADEALFHAVLESGVVAIAYETVSRPDGSLPLLVPMSEVAGRLAPQEGARCLEKPFGGRGVLMGGVTGVPPANVLILGAGVVGENAARVAAGMGANVTVLDINTERLRRLEELNPERIGTRVSDEKTIRELLPDADMVIGAILLPGARADRLVTRQMLSTMKRGSVMVDVAIDQGGCFETSRPTTHHEPTYLVDGVIHYCVTNMPGAVPVTSTLGLTRVTLPYIRQLADLGWRDAVRANPDLSGGLSVVAGEVLNRRIADLYSMVAVSPDKLVG